MYWSSHVLSWKITAIHLWLLGSNQQLLGHNFAISWPPPHLVHVVIEWPLICMLSKSLFQTHFLNGNEDCHQEFPRAGSNTRLPDKTTSNLLLQKLKNNKENMKLVKRLDNSGILEEFLQNSWRIPNPSVFSGQNSDASEGPQHDMNSWKVQMEKRWSKWSWNK